MITMCSVKNIIPERHSLLRLLPYLLILLPSSLRSQDYSHNIFAKPLQQGLAARLWMGAQGLSGFAAAPRPDQVIGLEYPLNSFINHCSEIQLIVGAIVDTSTGRVPRYGYVVQGTGIGEIFHQGRIKAISDFYPVDTSRPWFHTSVYNADEPNKRNVDDDGDGLVDEDPLDGEDNDLDGRVDEDYGAISESDYYSSYTDTIRWYSVDDRESRPTGLKVWQRSFAWARDVREPIIPIEYNIINVSARPITAVYVGFRLGAFVGPIDVTRYFNNQIGGYWPELRTVWFHNPVDRGSTPFGYSILHYTGMQAMMPFRYRWIGPGDYQPVLDREFYAWLSGAVFPGEPMFRPDRDRSETTFLSALLSFGPIDTLFPGDTLSITIAVVGASLLEAGPDNLYDNSRKAQTLYARNYFPPVVLPGPAMSVTPGPGSVRLTWGETGDARDPRARWDEMSRLAEFYPEDHWRRADPPERISTGGRIFEGFRLYRSEDPAGIANTFTLIRQWDIADSIGPVYEYDTGIETTFTDINLVTGKSYWYSLTSFGIPDLYRMKYLDWDMAAREETLATRSTETSILASREKIKLSFAPSKEPDEVLVVPNPYRVDENYTFESGGWEGRQGSWKEEKRLIKFIRLPPRCTIRIFSLSGDIVTTLFHDDPVRGEEDWNLLSESGRAIASGLYVFTVESTAGRQVGKFVIIR